MPGFNVGGPLPQLTPDVLAKMAAASFRPPSLMSMPGMAPMPQDPGLAGFKPPGGLGLAGWRPQGATRTGGDADLGGYGGSPPLDASGIAMNLPSPNGMQYGADGMPVGPAQGGDPSGFSKIWSFLTGGR